MAPLPGPYSGTSTLALVARASAFTFGLVYGNIKLKIHRVSPSSVNLILISEIVMQFLPDLLSNFFSLYRVQLLLFL
ncbi:hypothetical protein Ddye_007223 [Dipteronia dyeriana]|uniref:Uncharacterized protein n=1 Tax=Dipteronia dyeriana TaxID=168575 RepID=A0AAD9XJJ9_9ROSI|nr:hypothetical protein Ddye_007223 [Dipteronia dyeriana]